MASRRKGRCLRASGFRHGAQLYLEVLEDRTLPSTFDVVGGAASYLAASGIDNKVLLAQSGPFLILSDQGETISPVPAPKLWVPWATALIPSCVRLLP